MAGANITEWALRAAVNQFSSSGSTEEPSSAIETLAKNRASSLVIANTSSNDRVSHINLQGDAIELAVKGLLLAGIAISHQTEVMHEQRLEFDKERQAGIATFTVPTNKQYAKLSKEDQVIQNYLDKVNEISVARYFGIKSDALTEKAHVMFHSVLPFYQMSNQIMQPLASSALIDRERILTSLFFKSALPSAISNIDHDFTGDSSFKAFFESAWQKDNYLNDLRAPRLIMMSLANMLWNLQHPVDKDGLPLSYGERIALCEEMERFINTLLNTESDPQINIISNEDINLESFVRRVEVRIKGLKKAFIDEKLHTFSVDDMISSAHHSLRIMDKSVFKLIYRREQPAKKTSIPDEHAAQEIASIVGFINEIVGLNPELLAGFTGVIDMHHRMQANVPPQTVIDILTIFLHATDKDKELIYKNLAALDMEEAGELIYQLKHLNKKYLQPIYAIAEQTLDLPHFDKHKHSKISQWASERLLPLMALIFEDYRIQVTTSASEKKAKQTAEQSHHRVYGGQQQLKNIISNAEIEDGYYQWDLSALVTGAKGQFRLVLDQLPQKQQRLTKITELLDNLKELVSHYRSFLAYGTFQKFLIQCINEIEKEYQELGAYVIELDKERSAGSGALSRSLKEILDPMMIQIKSSITGFEQSAELFESKVSLPEFTSEQRQLLQTKVTELQSQYQLLFEKPAELDQMVDMLQAPIPQTKPMQKQEPDHSEENSVSNHVIVSLTQVIMNCRNGMSFWMRADHKTSMLNSLLQTLRHKPNCTKEDVSNIVKELARIVMSYRQNYFFTAEYGKTRSAKELCSSLMKYNDDVDFPLAKYLFGDSHDINLQNEQDIIIAMKSLGNKQGWVKSAEELNYSKSITNVF